jgi:hypothetical protein
MSECGCGAVEIYGQSSAEIDGDAEEGGVVLLVDGQYVLKQPETCNILQLSLHLQLRSQPSLLIHHRFASGFLFPRQKRE